jgi:hypothetical protein
VRLIRLAVSSGPDIPQPSFALRTAGCGAGCRHARARRDHGSGCRVRDGRVRQLSWPAGHSGGFALRTSGNVLRAGVDGTWCDGGSLEGCTPARSVPARNAYLPHLGDEDTWQLVTAAGGRVISDTLNVSPSSLSKAVARARREMRAGTRSLWTRTVPGACSHVELKSAVLAAALGHGQVNVEFDNASTGRARPITEELFSVFKAPTVAQAPAC